MKEGQKIQDGMIVTEFDDTNDCAQKSLGT
jgi:hypothetical protein